MQKTKQARTSRSTKVETEEEKELNNVKITDYQSKDMLLLTSQIFDIR